MSDITEFEDRMMRLGTFTFREVVGHPVTPERWAMAFRAAREFERRGIIKMCRRPKLDPVWIVQTDSGGA